ncbi:MAG TPA: type II toxin-antitoxin system HicB family antitoxin [Candidatus Gastranaerophilales bacterium]|nr:type II toxin-antitoxin system HicB family antitoxin [Candidatus Gastranaerophilales bacterium]
MKNILEYKNFCGSVEFSQEDNCLFGKILFVEDLILYEGKNVEELISNFQESVEEYIEDCKESGKEPFKKFKGTLNVRISPELHKKAALKAQSQRKSINSIIYEALEKYIA